MTKSIKTTHFPFVFIALQFITAIFVMIFFTAQLGAALEFLKNLLFYILIFIVPIFLIIKKAFNVKPINYLCLNYNGKAIIRGLMIAVGMALIFFITNMFKVNSVKFDLPSILTLTGVVLAGLFEEIIFRGFYLQTIQGKLGFVWANVITAFLFSALHFGEVLQQNYAQLGILFVMGLFLGYVFDKTKSLWVPIIIHSTFNILIFLFR